MYEKYKKMSTNTFLHLNNPLFVDLREREEYENDHIKDAVNFPISCFLRRVKQLMRMRQPLILYAASKSAVDYAIMVLKGNGFHRVYNGGSVLSLRTYIQNKDQSKLA